jgi:hypothetical protein
MPFDALRVFSQSGKRRIAMTETLTPRSKERSATASENRTAEMLGDLEHQRKHADQQMRPALERQRSQAQESAEKSLDSEAIAAIQQTERALNAIMEARIDEALAAIEQATGKINVLLSRNPATALIPVNVQVSLIDTAPRNREVIVTVRDLAEVSLDVNNLPAARTLLDSLRSEIRVRIYHLPLATYPAALQEAARLLDQKKIQEAGTVLLLALNTLAIIDQVTALPLLLAREAINGAQPQSDREAAQRLLEFADDELQRGEVLGYATADPEYTALRDEIKSIRKKLQGNENASSVFTSLKEKIASLIHRQSERRTGADVQKQPQKAA